MMRIEAKQWSTSLKMWERSKQVLAGGVSSGLRGAMQPHPLFFDRAEGGRLWDVDNHELIDYVLGWGPIILGHCSPNVVKAVQHQVTRGELFGAQHPLEYLVAEQVLSHFPFAERLIFSNTGSESVQIAIRLARAATGRVKILKFIGHYHGWSDTILASYRPPVGTRDTWLESRGQHPKVAKDIIAVPWNDEAALERVMAEQGSHVSAVIVEPILANSGVIEAKSGFLAYIRNITRRYGSVLICDEVITGYRVGLKGATGRFGIEPDLVVLGKAIANGFPLSAVVGHKSLIDLVAGGGVVHAGTFNGNPIVLAAAKQTLAELEVGGTYEHLEALAQSLAQGLRERLREHKVEGSVHQVGGIAQVLPGIVNVLNYDDYASADWSWYNKLSVELLRQGIFVLPGGRLYLCLAHTSEDIDQTIQAFDNALASLDDEKPRATKPFV